MNNYITCSGVYVPQASNVTVKFRRMRADALPPFAPNVGDAGYDFLAQENLTFMPGEPVQIETGIALEIPQGYAGLILGRSGNAFKRGLHVDHHGLIDSSYRGEVFILIKNRTYEPIMVTRGDKIAQMIIIPVLSYGLQEVRELPDSSRGINGLGSSGIVGVQLV